MQKTATRCPFLASDDVLRAVDRLGRTEDVHFSPDNHRLAIAGMIENKVLILDIEIKSEPGKLALSSPDYLEIVSPAFGYPHGLFWIDNRHLIVGNRRGEVTIFAIPTVKPNSRVAELAPIETIKANSADLLHTPGSVSVSKIGMGLYEVLICNNYAHHITRHILDERNAFRLKGSTKLLSEGLDIPDGIAHSHCGNWIAVSNHYGHNVLLYENTPALDPSHKPGGTLQGVNYPHGLRFTSDDRYLLVADAGAPFVHIYSSGDGWFGEHQPAVSMRVLDDDAFERGRTGPEEGGPKGIDLTRDDGILVASCEEQPIVVIDFKETRQALDQSTSRPPRPFNGIAEAERARAPLLNHIDRLVQTNMSLQRELRQLAEDREHQIQQLLDKRLERKLRRIGASVARFFGSAQQS